MKYTPLDLSFLSSRYAPNRDAIANTAQMIMANAGWSQPSQVTLKEIAKAQKEANSPHKQSFLSSVFDLLSTPLYGVANALDESIAGHQSDNNDSVLDDTLKTVGGVFTGGVKGVLAGWRGATGIVDALPGIDINDEWQSDPTDKTHFSDVNARLVTKMSSKDAANPDNWSKALENARKEKGEVPDWLGNLFYGNLETGNQQQDMKNLFQHLGVVGAAEDIGGDPLNYVLPGAGATEKLAGSAAKATEGITEGLNSARAMENTNKAALEGLMLHNRGFVRKGPIGSLPFKPVAEGADEIAAISGPSVNVANVPALFEKGNFKTLAKLHRREIPIEGFELGTKEQKELVKRITSLAAHGEKGWIYKAGELLQQYPRIDFTRTEQFLQNAVSKVDAKGLKHVPEKMAPVLRAHIAEDAKATSEVAARNAERRLSNKPGNFGADVGVLGDKLVQTSEKPRRLTAQEAKIANKIVSRFEGEILGTRKPAGTGEGLAVNHARKINAKLSGPQQARLWNQINNELKFGSTEKKFAKATKILRAVEGYFESKGVKAYSGTKIKESVPLRLSRVAEAIGPGTLGNSHALITGILRGDAKALEHLTPEQIDVLQKLRAGEALAEAPAVNKGIRAGEEVAASLAKAPVSVGRKAEATNKLIREIQDFTIQQGSGPVGAHIVGEYMGNLLGKGDPVASIFKSSRLQTEAWLGNIGKGAHGPKNPATLRIPGSKGAKVTRLVNGVVNDPEFVRSVTNAISKAANLPNPAKLSGVVGAAAKVNEWLGARFNAAYGVQDMREIFTREQAFALSTIGRRAKLINELGKRFDPNDLDLWHEAFRAAQQNGIASGTVAELQSEIAKVMENLFGGTGLRSGAIADSTIVGRNRLLLEELNKNLKRFGLSEFQFVAKKVKDADGVVHDFSKGLDWMKSWEAWNVKKPYEFLHRIQNVMEHTVREKTMFDEIITRFASPAKHGDVKYGVDHPRLGGYFFTEEGARQAKVFVRMLDEVSTPNSKALQYFDHVLSKLKASLTIYIPGHHMTNLLGDLYYNWIAGVNKPIRYDQAIKTMLSQKGRYIDFADFDRLTGPDALKNAIARSVAEPGSDLAMSSAPAGRKVIVTMQNGTKLTADMIYTAAMREGILPVARVLEDVGSDVTSILDKWRPLGGMGQKGVHEVSEIRDHIPRLAQFIDGVAKSKGSFTQAVSASARSVRKWHPDGLDVTKFERTVMKRVFPFYSWTRKAIPLAIQSAILAGPKVMAYPRLMEGIAIANGVEPAQGTTDPFPNDQMFPDWLRNRGIGPIAGSAGNYTVVNPSTPVLDVLSLLGQPGQSSIDMLNPMGKVPIETAQGQTLGRNVPIGNTNQQWLDYFAKQIPVASQLGRASGQFGVSDSTKAEGFPNYTNILNLLTGAKKVDTGKYQKSAQFDLRDYFKQKSQQQGR